MVSCRGTVRGSLIVIHKIFGEFVEIAHPAVFGGTARGYGFLDASVPFQLIYVVIVQKLIGGSLVVACSIGATEKLIISSSEKFNLMKVMIF